MLAPWAITIRRPSGESDFILTRADGVADESVGAGYHSPKVSGDENNKNITMTPFQRPKANSSSCITDGIKSSQFLRVMGAYMVGPKDNTLDFRKNLYERFPPTLPCSFQEKTAWQKIVKRDMSKFKKAASSFKGSVDSLLCKFRRSEDAHKQVSTFIYTPVGLIFEVLASEERQFGTKETRNKTERLVKTTSNSPFYDSFEDQNGFETLQEKLDQLMLQTRNFNSYDGRTFKNLEHNSSFSSNSNSKENSNNNLYHSSNSVNNSNENVNNSHLTTNKRNSSCSNIYKLRKYSLTNTQLPKDFSHNYSDKSFASPLHALSISQGRFKASIPLDAFPRGHICLKVRGYRLEIVHIIKCPVSPKCSSNGKNKPNTLSVKNNFKNSVKVEPICLNSTLNDYSKHSEKFSTLASQASYYRYNKHNYRNNVVPNFLKCPQDDECSNHTIGLKNYKRKDCSNNHSNNNPMNSKNNNCSNGINNICDKNDNINLKKCDNCSIQKEHSTALSCSLDANYLDASLYNKTKTSFQTSFEASETSHTKIKNVRSTQNNSQKVQHSPNTKASGSAHAERELALADNDTLVAYNHLGNVSIPIFVEPSSLEFDVKGGWMELSGKTKLCISNNCLDLNDEEESESKLR